MTYWKLVSNFTRKKMAKNKKSTPQHYYRTVFVPKHTFSSKNFCSILPRVSLWSLLVLNIASLICKQLPYLIYWDWGINPNLTICPMTFWNSLVTWTIYTYIKLLPEQIHLYSYVSLIQTSLINFHIINITGCHIKAWASHLI